MVTDFVGTVMPLVEELAKVSSCIGISNPLATGSGNTPPASTLMEAMGAILAGGKGSQISNLARER